MPKTAERPAKRLILVVDDDPAVSGLLQALLTQRGLDVETVATGHDGLTALAGCAHDIAILDVKLPDVSGLEVLARMRARGDDTPVLVISTMTDKSCRDEALRLGAAAFLGKPFDMTRLLGTIAEVLRG